MTVYLFTKMKEKMQEYFYPKEETYSKDEIYSKNEIYSKSETYSQTQADNKFALSNHIHDVSGKLNNTGWTPNKNLITNSNGTITTEDKYSHPTSGIQASTTPSLKKIAYDDKGHITAVDNVSLENLNISDINTDIDLSDYYTKQESDNKIENLKNNELRLYQDLLGIDCEFNDIIILDYGPQGYNIPNIDKGRIIAKYYDKNEYVYVKEDGILYFVENHDEDGNGSSKIFNITNIINNLQTNVQTSINNLQTSINNKPDLGTTYNTAAYGNHTHPEYIRDSLFNSWNTNIKWFSGDPLLDQQGSWSILRNGFVFINIYMHFAHPGTNRYYAPPVQIASVSGDARPISLVETSAHLVIDNKGRYPATLQVTTDGIVRAFAEPNIDAGFGLYGTIIYPHINYEVS